MFVISMCVFVRADGEVTHTYVSRNNSHCVRVDTLTTIE